MSLRKWKFQKMTMMVLNTKRLEILMMLKMNQTFSLKALDIQKKMTILMISWH